MSVNLPSNLLPKCLKQGMFMPQLTLPIPPNTSITFEATVEPCKPLVMVGFSFSGRDAAGNPITGYDFTTGKGLIWQCVYRQLPEILPDYKGGPFYLTSDYLDKYVPYGPRVITKSLEITITNNTDSPVYFTQTLYGYQVYLVDLLVAMGFGPEEREKILRLYCPGQLFG